MIKTTTAWAIRTNSLLNDVLMGINLYESPIGFFSSREGARTQLKAWKDDSWPFPPNASVVKVKVTVEVIDGSK